MTKYLPVHFTQEELAVVEHLSAVNYSPEKIAKYFQMEMKPFMRVYFDRDSELRKAYERGRLVAEFNILNKQRELAESGNITSAQIYLKEAKRIETENLKNQIFFADEID